MTDSPHDVVLGKLALSAGLLSKEELEACREELRRLRERGENSSLAQLLVARGHATGEQLVNLAKTEAERAKSGTARSSSEHSVPAKAAAAAAEATASTQREAELAAQARAAVESRESPIDASGTGSEPSASGSASSSHSARRAVATGPSTPEREQPAQAGKAQESPSTEEPSSSGTQTKSRQSPIEGYEISQKLGSGAMGAVYKARHSETARVVALKVLPPKLAKNPSYVERFQREARAAKRLQHENIVGAYDIGESNGLFYFAMEFVEGKTVRDLLEEKRSLPEGEALMIVRQVAQALNHAREQEVVHRDIKPDNIMVATDGVAKLCDMGLAKHLSADPELTMHGAAVGTPWYISPEQARGERQIDTRADIYSLGATLFHMVAGGPPYIGATAAVIMTRHINDPIPDPRRGKSHLSAGLVAVIHRMMAKSLADRYQTPEELIEDIDAVLFGDKPKHAPLVALEKQERAQPEATRPGKPAAEKQAMHSTQGPASTKRRTKTAQASGRQGTTKKAGPTSKRSATTSTRKAPLGHGGNTRGAAGGAPRNRLRDVLALLLLGGVAVGLAVLFTTLGERPENDGEAPSVNGTAGPNGTEPETDGGEEPREEPRDPAAEAQAQLREQLTETIAAARDHLAAQRVEPALALLSDLFEDGDIRRAAPELLEQARQLYREAHRDARREAVGAFEAARDRMDRERLIRGENPDFGEALRLLEGAVPEHLRFLVEDRLESRRDLVHRAARVWLDERRERFEGLLEAGAFDEAEALLAKAREAVLPEQHDELEDWPQEIAEARRQHREAQQEKLRREARKAFERLTGELEPLIEKNRLVEARTRVEQAQADERFERDESFAPRLGLELERIEDLQRFWQAALDHARAIEGSETVLELPERVDFRVREVRAVPERTLRQLGGTGVTLELIHPDTGRERSSAFSTLDPGYAHALGHAGLARAGGSRLERSRAEATFLVVYRPPQTPMRVAPVLTFLQGEAVLEQMHPQVATQLRELAETRMRTRWHELMPQIQPALAEGASRERIEASIRSLHSFRRQWERLGMIEREGEIDRWLSDALEALEQRLAALPEADPQDEELAGRFHATQARRLDAKTIELRYDFDAPEALEDFEQRTPSESRIEVMRRGGLRIRGPESGSAGATLTWRMPLKERFDVEFQFTGSADASVLANLYFDSVFRDSYTVPLAVRDDDETPVRFGLYFGRWRNFLGPATTPERLVGGEGIDLAEGAVTLRITRSAEGDWRVELNDKVISVSHAALESGQLQLAVPSGEIELTHMRYRGPLTEE